MLTVLWKDGTHVVTVAWKSGCASLNAAGAAGLTHPLLLSLELCKAASVTEPSQITTK